MNTVLIVEDDRNIQNILAYNLEKSDFKVFTAESGVEALEILQEEDDISIVLMDVMMPEMDGFDCTMEIRKFSDVPIIMLTALEDETSILHGFDCGVDDYVVKPFSFRQLLARINAHMRRPFTSDSIGAANTLNKKDSIIHINNIELNTSNYVVQIGDKRNTLTNIEYKLFMFLYQNPNQAFDRDTLLKEVWGTSYTDSRTVDVNISRLRGKVELLEAEPQNIKTKRGKGYYLEVR